MERCPPEILNTIFELATQVDDGRTGCALSLVSRYIHDASQFARYQSVALSSLERMVAFIDAIYHKPPVLRRVKNIFMDTKRDAFPTASSTVDWKVSTTYFQLRERDKERTHQIQIMDPPNGAIAIIMYLVSPTLELAHIVYSFPRKTVFPAMMGAAPSLRELTLYGHAPDTLQYELLSLPSLRRLHLSGCPTLPQRRRGSTVALINATTPNLTHLRISGIMDQRSYLELDGMLDDKIPIPSTLKRILIQIHPDSGYESYSSLVLKDRILSAARRDSTCQITLLDFSSRVVASDEQMGEWFDRIAGRGGCWMEDDPIRENGGNHESLSAQRIPTLAYHPQASLGIVALQV